MPESKHTPTIRHLRNRWLCPLNVRSVTRTDEDGTTSTMHVYDQIELDQTKRPTDAEIAAARQARIRAARDRALDDLTWRHQRHQTQLAQGGKTPDLSDAEYQALLAQMQHLRDVPQNIENGDMTLANAENELEV